MKEKSSKSTAKRYTSASAMAKTVGRSGARKPIVKVEVASKPVVVVSEIREKAVVEAVKPAAVVAPKVVPVEPASVIPDAPTFDSTVADAPVATAPVLMEMPIPAAAPISAEISELVTALRHDNADVARDAATSLGELGNASAVGPLIQVLHNSEGFFHAVVRAAAAASLGRLGDTRAVDALIIAVRDPQAEPSSEAIRALGVIGDRAALGTLLDVIRNPTGYFLGSARLAAVLALGGFRDDSAMALLRAVGSDPTEDPAIRQAALSCA